MYAQPCKLGVQCREIRQDENETKEGQLEREGHAIVKPATRRHKSRSSSESLQTRGSNLRSLFFGWKMELGACLLLLVAILATIWTLVPHDGKPVPQWPYKLSVNTLIAVYGNIAKATIIYITASCIAQMQWVWFSSERPLADLSRFADVSQGGLAGAFGWLRSPTRVLHNSLVSFGAIIIIIANGIEPFMQQLTSYVDCSIALEGPGMTATIPRTNYAAYIDLDLDDFLTATLNGNPIDVAAAGCVTGNCSFPSPVTTAAICHVCEDTSSSVQVYRNCTTIGANGVLGEEVPCPSFDEIDSNINYTVTSALPSGLQTMWWAALYSNNVDLASEPLYEGLRQQLLAVNLTRRGGDEEYDQYLEFLAGSTAHFEAGLNLWTGDPLAGCEGISAQKSWKCRGYGAARCWLRPCTRTFHASMSAGLLNESLSEETEASLHWAASEAKDEWYTTVNDSVLDLNCISTEELEKLQRLGVVGNASSRWIPYALWQQGPWNYSYPFNSTGLPPPDGPYSKDTPFPGSLWVQNCLYIMDHLLPRGLLLKFAGLILDATQSDRNAPTIVSIDTASIHGSPVTWADLKNFLQYDMRAGSYIPRVFKDSLLLQAFFNKSAVEFDTINSVFANLSTTLTTIVRTHNDGNHSNPAVGTIDHYATCIEVTWGWLALPVALAVGSMIILVATTIMQSRNSDPLWKNNVLALIFHGPAVPSWQGASRYSPERAEQLKTAEGMEKVASRIIVRLDRKVGDQLQLVNVNKYVEDSDKELE